MILTIDFVQAKPGPLLLPLRGVEQDAAKIGANGAGSRQKTRMDKTGADAEASGTQLKSSSKDTTSVATVDPKRDPLTRRAEDFAAAVAKMTDVIPTSDLFHDMSLFRQEVRAELMQADLDDRHDIEGNTIYRMTFDTTIIAGNRTEGLAAIVIDLQEPDTSQPSHHLRESYKQMYEDWGKEMQDIYNKSLDAMLALLKSGEFRTRDPATWHDLYKFFSHGICDISNEQCELDLRHSYEQYRNHVHQFTETSTKPLFDAQYGRIASINQIGVPKKDPFERFRLFCMGFRKISDWDNYLYKPAPDIDSGIYCGSYFLDEYLANDMLFSLIGNPQLGVNCEIVKGADISSSCIMPSDLPKIRCALAAFQMSRPEKGELAKYFDVKAEGGKLGNCDIVVRTTQEAEAKDKIRQLNEKLRKDIEVYAYGVSPKTVFQRLSSASTANQTIQAALAGINQDIANGKAEFSRRRGDSQSLEAIEGHPLVIGFGSARPLEISPESAGENVQQRVEKDAAKRAVKRAPKNDETTFLHQATFGWAIAPKRGVTSSGENGNQHEHQQLTLSAIVSVPSWWPMVTLTVKTCWLADNDFITMFHISKELAPLSECTHNSKSARYLVKLPGRAEEISRKLGFKLVKTPWIDAGQNWFLTIGRPGQLIINGLRLWRSTVVMVDSQRADEILVLPNMKGIVAKFDCVRRPDNYYALFDKRNANYQALLRIWTSEGTESAKWVYLLDPRSQDPAYFEKGFDSVTQQTIDAATGRPILPDPTSCPDDQKAESDRKIQRQKEELQRSLSAIQDNVVQELMDRAKVLKQLQ